MANPTLAALDERWTRQFADFGRRLDAVSASSSPTLEQLVEEFRSFKEMVQGMLQLLHKQLNDSAKVIDAMDMRQRRKILLFNGIAENPDIDDKQAVLNVIQNKLGISSISGDGIKRCHRLGAQNEDRVRAVLVHFRDHSTKADIWKSKSKLKGSNITLSEFLTRVRQIVHKKARTHFQMKNVWTLDGVIYIKTPGGERVKIVSEEELDKLVTKYPEASDQPVPSGDEQSAQQSSNRQQEVRQKPVSPPRQGDESKRPRRAAQKK